MDVVTSTAFSVDIDSVNNPADPFVTNVKKMLKFDLFNPLFLLVGKTPFMFVKFVQLFLLSNHHQQSIMTSVNTVFPHVFCLLFFSLLSLHGSCIRENGIFLFPCICDRLLLHCTAEDQN